MALRNDAGLDALGLRLLSMLRADSRRSATSLARALGISRPAVQERMARMEERGIVAGYTIVEGPGMRSGAQAALVSVRIAERPCEPVLRRLRVHPAVERVFSTSGDIDAVLLVRAADPAALSAIADALAAIEGVSRVETRPILREL